MIFQMVYFMHESTVQVCRNSEERRLEEVGTRIRSRREEADQEKKDRQVIYTDRLPPAKRTRCKLHIALKAWYEPNIFHFSQPWIQQA